MGKKGATAVLVISTKRLTRVFGERWRFWDCMLLSSLDDAVRHLSTKPRNLGAATPKGALDSTNTSHVDIVGRA